MFTFSSYENILKTYSIPVDIVRQEGNGVLYNMFCTDVSAGGSLKESNTYVWS